MFGRICDSISLVSSFTLQLQPRRNTLTPLFVFAIRDRDDSSFANQGTVEGDRGNLRERFILRAVADDLIVDPDHGRKCAHGKWTTVYRHSPGPVDDGLLASNLNTHAARQLDFFHAKAGEFQIAVGPSRFSFADELARTFQ